MVYKNLAEKYCEVIDGYWKGYNTAIQMHCLVISKWPMGKVRQQQVNYVTDFITEPEKYVSVVGSSMIPWYT